MLALITRSLCCYKIIKIHGNIFSLVSFNFFCLDETFKDLKSRDIFIVYDDYVFFVEHLTWGIHRLTILLIISFFHRLALLPLVLPVLLSGERNNSRPLIIERPRHFKSSSSPSKGFSFVRSFKIVSPLRLILLRLLESWVESVDCSRVELNLLSDSDQRLRKFTNKNNPKLI